MRIPILIRLLALSLCGALFLSSCSSPEAREADGGGLDHRVHEGEGRSLSKVSSVSEVAWEWTVPDEDVNLAEVLPGTAGPVMVISDGVIALDGETGEELWHYRMESGGVQGAWSTPEGREVLVTVSGGAEDAAVLLDAGTGELIAEFETGVPGGTDRTAVVTSHTGVIPPDRPDDPVSAFSLGEGGSAWTYEPPEREGSAGVIVEDVFRAGDTVVVTAAYNDGSTDGAAIDQGMLVVGLDGETGESLWEVEQEFTADMRHVPEYKVSPSEEVLFLGVGAEQRHEFLLDPATGEEIPGELYRDRSDRHPVALLDDGYVDMAVDYEQDVVEYRHMSFAGEELAQVSARLRAADREDTPDLALEVGLLRLDYVGDEELARGPVTAEFVEWGAEEEPQPLRLGMTANEEWWQQPDVSGAIDPPVMVSVPGAVVVTEQNRGPWTVVGLN